MANKKVFLYVIDLDERGEFRAHVDNQHDQTIFGIEGGAIFDDGYMRNKKDIAGLELYLKEMGYIPDSAKVTANESQFKRLARLPDLNDYPVYSTDDEGDEDLEDEEDFEHPGDYDEDYADDDEDDEDY